MSNPANELLLESPWISKNLLPTILILRYRKDVASKLF